MRHCIAIISLTCMLAVTAGCSGTKNLNKADAPLPDGFALSGIGVVDSLTIADIEWWRFYSDSTLCNIIERTLENNRGLLAAGARVEEMRSLYGIEKVNILPDINLGVSGDRESTKYSGGNQSVSPEYGLKASINWEVNLWGKLSWLRKKGASAYMASVEEYRAMRMTLIADVASAYFRLIALDNELNIVRQTLQTRSESLEQARIRFEGGLTSETVYQQAKVEYSTTASLIPELERQIVVVKNSLCLLMGDFDFDGFPHGNMRLDVSLPDKIAVGVPSELLKRRPDLRAAEHRLASSMAAVGVSYADRFPSLRIGITAGFENDEMSSFFDSPYTYLIGSVAGPVFDFKRRKRRYQAAIAAYDQARYDYEQTVFKAFSEVNNSIVGYRRAIETRELKNALRDAADKYVKLATLQYRAGTLNYIDVLDAQRRYFDAEIGLSNSLRDEYLALVALYKSLGGGWQTDMESVR